MHPTPGVGKPKPQRKPKPVPVKKYPQARCLYAYDAQVSRNNTQSTHIIFLIIFFDLP